MQSRAALVTAIKRRYTTGSAINRGHASKNQGIFEHRTHSRATQMIIVETA